MFQRTGNDEIHPGECLICTLAAFFVSCLKGQLRQQMTAMSQVVEGLGVMKPYSYVLEDDDKDSIAELYVVDDDTIIVGGDLMDGLDEDLDHFFNQLMDEHC